MNILHIRATNFYGGPERQVHLHAKEAIGSDYEVSVASFTEHARIPELIQRVSADGISTHAFKVNSAYDFRALSMLRRFIAQHQVDVLCTHDYRTTLYGWLLSRRHDFGWVAFSRGFTDTNAKVRLYQWTEKMLARYADMVVSVSSAQGDKMRALGVSNKRLVTVRNAIDVDLAAAVDSVDLRGHWNLPEDSILCVAAGRFSREKGQVILVRAAATALRQEPRLRFLLFGDGPDRKAIQELARDLGVENSVLCPGFERDVLGCIKGADMVINPSWSEGMPNVVLEGMALAVPVVATAVGGVPEIIEDGHTGMLVEPGDTAGLADAVVNLAGDPSEARLIGEAGRNFVRRNCTFRNQFEALAEVYELVAAEQSR